MKVHFRCDLTYLLVYFYKCDHWSWCVRVFWGKILHSVVLVCCELPYMNAAWSPPSEPTKLGLVFHLDNCYSVSLTHTALSIEVLLLYLLQDP